MALYDRSSVVGFGLNPLDRLSEKRDDMAFVETLREAPTTRFLVLAGDIPVFRKQGDAHALLFSRDEAAAFGEPAHDIFLGQDPHGGALFALGFDKARAAALGTDPGLALIDLRTVAMQGHVTPAVLGELGGAKAMLDWHQRHRFCANCGAPSRVSAAGVAA
ncbi:MAG: NUDIX-like domain-containing protein [Pararobbsia sp.]